MDITKPKPNHIVVGIHLPNRIDQATQVQTILTKYGCNIKTRLGLHEVNNEYCAINGLVLLEMIGAKKDIDSMIEELKVENIDVQQMVFLYKK